MDFLCFKQPGRKNRLVPHNPTGNTIGPTNNECTIAGKFAPRLAEQIIFSPLTSLSGTRNR
jgi:hypothetical protein